VYRFEQRRELALRVEVGRWRDTDGAGAGRAEVGEDVAEQVRGYDYVKAIRLQYEAGGPITVSSTAIKLTVIRNTSIFLFLCDIIVSWTLAYLSIPGTQTGVLR